MKTRSGKSKYGDLGLRSGTARWSKTRNGKKHLTYNDTVISIVHDVKLDRGERPKTCNPGGNYWILSLNRKNVRLYTRGENKEMDWSIVPWDTECLEDVGWIIRNGRSFSMVHFDRLDITVSKAAMELRNALRAVGNDEVIFDACTARFHTVQDRKGKTWGRDVLLRDTIQIRRAGTTFVACAFA